MHKKPLRPVICLGLGLLSLFGGRANADECAARLSAFEQALKAQDIVAVKAAEERVIGAACGHARLLDVQQRRAKFQLRLAQSMKDDPNQTAARETLIAEAALPEVLWIAGYLLGELRLSQRRFSEATDAFESAIEIAKNPGKTKGPPKSSEIDTLMKLANVAKLLAANEEGRKGEFVAAARDYRDGSLGGTWSESVRGTAVTSVPVAIKFVYATATPTEIGFKYMRELFEAIKEQRPRKVLLVGHADERGSDAYNMRLSKSRVVRVVAYLRNEFGKEPEHVRAPKIEIGWRGERQPLSFQNNMSLSQEEIWALNRRVEWVRPKP